MAKQISQETFDTVVKENMEDFEMSAEEALNDAISQFEAQGVRLDNIVKDVSMLNSGSSKHAVIQAIEALEIGLHSDTVAVENVNKQFTIMQTECERDLAFRILAAKSGGYLCIMKGLNTDCLLATLKAFVSLTDGQPDILTDDGVDRLLEILDSHQNEADIISLSTRVIRQCCTKHETNRQTLVSKDLIAKLVAALETCQNDSHVVKEICLALRTLTFDDDVRVPFGKAHDHAKLIVTEADALKRLLNLSQAYKDDTSVLSELFATISCLAVRNEFCQEIMDLGGLAFVLSTLENSMNHQGLVKQILGVLKAISGNDQVKVAIVAQNGAPLIVTATDKHIQQPSVAEMSCSAIASIVLRNPAHCKAFMEAQAADVLVKIMQLHPGKTGVQKKACMAVRNLVARSKEYCATFIELGIEELVRRAMNDHSECQDEGKAALRDLDCKVELIERWTGEGKGIAN